MINKSSLIKNGNFTNLYYLLSEGFLKVELTIFFCKLLLDIHQILQSITYLLFLYL